MRSVSTDGTQTGETWAWLSDFRPGNANLRSTSTIDSPFEYVLLGPSGRKYGEFESTLSMMLEDPLDSASCHNHKSHRTSLVQLLTQAKCGSNERPSSIELYALAALTEREIAEINGRTWRFRAPPKNPNISKECYFMFPVCPTYIFPCLELPINIF